MGFAFFFSYARNDGLGDSFIDRFFRDLEMAVRRLSPRFADAEHVGFRDTRSIGVGEEWPAALDAAISTCRSFVALYSPSYFASDDCGREWAAFRQRLQRVREPGRPVAPLQFPVLWEKDPLRRPLPAAVRDVQYTHAEFGTTYAEEGLRYLLFVERPENTAEYHDFLTRFSRRLVQVLAGQELQVRGQRISLRKIQSAFSADDWRRHAGRGGSRGKGRRSDEHPGQRGFGERRDDFLALVEVVCRLRDQPAQLDRIRGDGVSGDHLRAAKLDGPIAQVWPVAALEGAPDEAALDAFVKGTHAFYRQCDPGVVSYLVCRQAPSAELTERAARQLVRMLGFPEYQNLVDFSSYVTAQTKRLGRDPRYSPRIYVSQRMSLDASARGEFTDDALHELAEWLSTPQGRFVLLLGDFGTGKTFLLRELARRMGDPEQPLVPGLVPVLVSMHDLEKDRSLDVLIAQHFAQQGLRDIPVERFRYMLREGRVALLFDGFDELALRVTYPKATEHFDTLLEAAAGAAKVVVTSRRQHFLLDEQVRSKLYERVELVPGHRIGLLQAFTREQIQVFLERYCGDTEKARARLALIDRVNDLPELSKNPRLLSFIADLPDEDLEEAGRGGGRVTAASLYQKLLDRWLASECDRVQPRGAAPGLSMEQRWKGVTALALRLWESPERTAGLDELTQEAGRVIEALGPGLLSAEHAAFQLGSGTLLVRDDVGRFGFIHQSVLEWLVARDAVDRLTSGRIPENVCGGAARRLSPLMADFMRDLAGRDVVVVWARETFMAPASDAAAFNADLVLSRCGETARTGAQLAGQDFHGQDLSGRDLSRADLTEANLAGARLVGARLTAAILARADLTDADLTETHIERADLSSANLYKARLFKADLTGAVLDGADLRRAKLIGADVEPSALAKADTQGAALPRDPTLEPWVTALGGRVHSLQFSGDGLLLAVAAGAVVRLFDAISGREIKRLSAHGRGVMCLSWSQSKPPLIACAQGDVVRLWDIATGREQRVLHGHTGDVRSVAVSPDGNTLASASDDATVRLWHIDTGEIRGVLRGHEDKAVWVAWSPDGRLLASGSNDRSIRLWNVDSLCEQTVMRGHDGTVCGIAFAPDGTRLATASTDKTIRLWNTVTGQEHQRLLGHDDSVWSLAYSSDGQLLASASRDRTVRVWDAGSARELSRTEGLRDEATSVAFSPDSQTLASGSADGSSRLVDVHAGRQKHLLQGHDHSVRSVAFDRDGRTLACASGNRTVQLWDVATGCLKRVLTGHDDWVWSVAFAPDGLTLASGSRDMTVRLWDVESGTEQLCMRGHEYGVLSVSFSPDGRKLASASADQSVVFWDVNTGKDRGHLHGHSDWVRSVAWSPDGTVVASSSVDRTIRLWDVATQRERGCLKGHEGAVWSVAYAFDGRTLASGSDDRTVRLWDGATGRERRCLSGHDDRVWAVAFSPNGELLASGSSDRTVRVWEVESGKERLRLQGQEQWVWSIAFSPDGTKLASSSSDNTIRLWDLATGGCLAILSPLPEGWVAFTPGGRYKCGGQIAGNFWHAINLCRFEVGELDPYMPGLRIPDDAPLF